MVEPAPDARAMRVELASPAQFAPIQLTLPVDGRLSGGLDLDPGSALSLRLDELDGPEAELAALLGVDELLAAPFRVGADADGLLVVGRAPGARPWSASDAELLSSYALEAATALELARSRVENQRLAMLEDRERIAADLHDMVIQRLFAAGMRLQGMLPVVTVTPLADRIREVVDDLDATIGEIRQAIFDLQHAEAGAPSLEAILQELVGTNEAYLGFRPTLTVEGDLDAVPASVAEQLVPVVIEALSNVARHADATEAEIVVSGSAGGVELEVTDNGVGASAPGRRGHGLGNMSRRARRLGGTFSIGPGPGGAGTTVRWSVGSHDAASR